MSDDLPTFDRPRKAISGALKVLASVGKCAGEVAESRKSGFSAIRSVYVVQTGKTPFIALRLR
jgi:hypothetical protein